MFFQCVFTISNCNLFANLKNQNKPFWNGHSIVQSSELPKKRFFKNSFVEKNPKKTPNKLSERLMRSGRSRTTKHFVFVWPRSGRDSIGQDVTL